MNYIVFTSRLGIPACVSLFFSFGIQRSSSSPMTQWYIGVQAIHQNSAYYVANEWVYVLGEGRFFQAGEIPLGVNYLVTVTTRRNYYIVCKIQLGLFYHFFPPSIIYTYIYIYIYRFCVYRCVKARMHWQLIVQWRCREIINNCLP